MVHTSLKQKTIIAFFWNAFGQFGKQGLQFIISIVLARVLVPEQFGLVAMLSIFIAVSELFVNGGFGAALVRKKTVSDKDYSTVFFVNIFMAISVYFVIYISASSVAIFYNQEILDPLLKVMGLNLIINSFGIVPATMFSRDLNLKPFVKINISTMILSGLVAIIMAINGWGVWSLVCQQLVASSSKTILYWVVNSWRPLFIFSYESFKDLFSYGIKIFLSELLDVFFRDIYLLIIGKYFSPISLGFYSRAKSLQQLPTGNIQAVMGRVSYLALLKIQNDIPNLRRKYREVNQLTAMLSAPMLAGLYVISDVFVKVLLTEKWLPCVPFIKILCLGGFFAPLQILSLNIMKIKKRSDLYLLQSIVEKIFVVCVLFVTVRLGITAMVTGQVILSIVFCLISMIISGKLIKCSIISNLYDILPYILISLVMAVCVHFVGTVISNELIRLLSMIICGGILYISMCWAFKVKAFSNALLLIRSK